MGFITNVLFRPAVTPPDQVKRQMVQKGIIWTGLTASRLSKLSRQHKILILALAQRIREAAKVDQITLVTPSLDRLENLLRMLVKEIYPPQLSQEPKANKSERFEDLTEREIAALVEKIPLCVIERMKNSAGVDLSTKTIEFGKLESVIKVNQGNFVPSQQAITPASK